MKKLTQGFNTAAQDSNQGSHSRESEALPLSHCALQNIEQHCFTLHVAVVGRGVGVGGGQRAAVIQRWTCLRVREDEHVHGVSDDARGQRRAPLPGWPTVDHAGEDERLQQGQEDRPSAAAVPAQVHARATAGAGSDGDGHGSRGYSGRGRRRPDW